MKKTYELIKKLITFESDKDNQEERTNIINYIKKYIKNKNVEIKEYEFENIKTIHAYNTQHNTKSILLSGHVDVIPSNEPDAFKPREDEKYIYGRGSGDMKAGMGIILDLFNKYNQEKNIQLLITSDEEIGSENGAKKLAEIIKPDCMLITEPTNNIIELKQKGAAWFDITVYGKGGHASRPWTNPNSIQILTDIITKINKEYRIKEKKWKSTMNIGSIIGGEIYTKNGESYKGSANIIAKKASARLDFRYTEEKTIPKLKEDIEYVIKEIEKEIPKEYKIEIKEILSSSILNTSLNNEYVQKFIEANKNNKKYEIGQTEGASDGRFFSEKGVPVFLFGPTSINHHAKNEHVEKETIKETYKAIDNFLKEI